MFCFGSGFTAKKTALIALVKHLHSGEHYERIKACFKCWSKRISPLELARLETDLILDRLPNASIVMLCMLHLDMMRDSFLVN